MARLVHRKAEREEETLTRLETMSMMSDIDLPLIALRLQIASATNILVQVSRLQDGSRKITQVTEVLGFDMNTSAYVTQDVFLRDYQGLGPNGEVMSELVPTGYIPQCAANLREHGMKLPDAVYQAAQARGQHPQ